ncbi:MAG: hypothetical protein ACYTEQ_26955 [Planctomycetota bacterium]|jgi:hypothetical protein
MKIDKTAQVTGGGLFTLEIGGAEISAVLNAPDWLEAGTVPNTVSITSLFVDSSFGSPGPTPPEPEPGEPNYEFFGRNTSMLGLGGAPPYITGYPIGGPMTILSELPPFPEPPPPVLNYGPNQIFNPFSVLEGDGVKASPTLWYPIPNGTMVDNQTSAGWADNPTFLIGSTSNQAGRVYHGNLSVSTGMEFVFEFDCVTVPAGPAPKFAIRGSFGGPLIYGPTEYGVGHVTSGVVVIPGTVGAIAVFVEHDGADAGQTWHIDNVKLRQVLP